MKKKKKAEQKEQEPKKRSKPKNANKTHALSSSSSSSSGCVRCSKNLKQSGSKTSIDFSTKKTKKCCCARKRKRENASIQSSCLLHQNHHLMLFASLMPPTRPRLSSDTPQASPSRKSFSLLQNFKNDTNTSSSSSVHVATCGNDGYVVVRDLSTKETIAQLSSSSSKEKKATDEEEEEEEQKPINAVATFQDKYIAIASDDHSVKLFTKEEGGEEGEKEEVAV